MSLVKILDCNYVLRRNLTDQISGHAGSFTRSGTVWHFNPQNVLTSYAADVPAFGADGLWSAGAYTQLCRDSEDVSGLTGPGPPTVVDTGETLYGFHKCTVTDDGAYWHRITVYDSNDDSSNPTTRTFFVFYYDTGTSGEIFIDFQDTTAGQHSQYSGGIGSANIGSNNAGALTILRDDVSIWPGCRVVAGYIEWDTPSNRVLIGIGPNSTDNSNIIVYGADVFNDTKYRLPHVPSSD